MKHITLSFLGIFMLVAASAQDKFGNGYYITSGGDSVVGFIQYKSKYDHQFIFRSRLKSPSEKVLAEQAKGFGFLSSMAFETVQYSKTKNTPAVPVFVNSLVSGDVDLMLYEGNYLIGSAQKGRFTLKKGKTSNEAAAMKNYQANTGAFNILFQECPTVRDAAQSTAINKAKLTELLKAYHECRGLPFVAHQTKKSKGVLNYGFFVGARYSKLSFGKPTTFVNTAYLYNTSFSSSAQPTFVLTAIFSGKQPSSVLAIQTELIYAKADYVGTYVYVNEDLANYYIKETTTTNLSYNRLSLSGGLRLTARSNSLNPYFSFGVAAQRFLNLKSHVRQVTEINSSTEEDSFDLPFDNGAFSVWATAGLKKKIIGKKAVFLDLNYDNSYISNSGRIVAVASRIGFLF